MNQTVDMMNVIHLGLDNGALALEEQRVAAATLKALTATERRIQEMLVELLAPDWMRGKATLAFVALAAEMERAARQSGSREATEAVATREG